MEQDQIVEPKKRIHKRLNPVIGSGIDVGKALELRWRGTSYHDIGRLMGVSDAAVIARLAKFRAIVDDPTLPTLFDTHALSLIKAVHLQSLLALQGKLGDRKSSVNNLAYANRQLFDQIRLLEGKSTSNISSLTKVIMEAHNKADTPDQLSTDVLDHQDSTP